MTRKELEVQTDTRGSTTLFELNGLSRLSRVTYTGRKNGFTHVCELSKCVVNLGL